MKDLLYLDKVIGYKTKTELLNDVFCWLYPFSNENIDGFYKTINFCNKDVLTVTSSGDHALNAIVNGAKCVSSFDSNPLAKYYSELKVAGVKALSFDDFFSFFYNKNIIFKQKDFLNINTYYQKIRAFLDDKNKCFWDYVFNNYDYNSLYKGNLFSDDFLSKNGLIESNKYLNYKYFYKLKEYIHDNKINYYDLNILDINDIDKKYDLVILSNIFAIIKEEDVLSALNKLKLFISTKLKKDGKVIFNYYYSNLLHAKSIDLIYDFDFLRDFYADYTHEVLSFEGSENLGKNGILRESLVKDKVLVLKK